MYFLEMASVKSIAEANKLDIQVRVYVVVTSEGWKLRQNFYIAVWRQNSF